MGPIVGKSTTEICKLIYIVILTLESTRAIYQRKLAALLQNGLPSEPEKTNGESAQQEEKFSDSEEELESQEPEQEQSAVEPEAAAPEPDIAPSAPVQEPTIATPEPLTSVRKRIVDRPPSSLSALPLVDRQVKTQSTNFITLS